MDVRPNNYGKKHGTKGSKEIESLNTQEIIPPFYKKHKTSLKTKESVFYASLIMLSAL
ncbi:hypothetical protein FC19_GL001618 [Liquorilactobacillus aquaticus DSM 21051]|uniref:Uncharacterized protein n=1 Tax=Liquorilactobacillus aquaticus DSM 21051 TaxID=1423725 RepID=A0A0R2DA68_9LACO|nr:hypothetical protein FC19_GL001618 [Liquorilactobacillus aquaticus DSM 21051]